MPYTADNPPVIKSNLGSEPWPDISTVFPQCNLYDEAGALITLDLDPATLMAAVANTPIWTYRVGDHVTVLDEDKEFFYTITRGVGGEIVDEGTVEVASTNSLSGVSDAITTVKMSAPGAVEIPNSGGASKSFKISAVPLNNGGSRVSADSVTVEILYADVTNTDITAVAMTNVGNDTWEYDWVVSDALIEDIASLTITTTKNATVLPHPTVSIQLFKREQFNPARISQGNVII